MLKLFLKHPVVSQGSLSASCYKPQTYNKMFLISKRSVIVTLFTCFIVEESLAA